MTGYRYRRPLNTPEFRGARARGYVSETADGLLIERDVEIPTRFGFNLYADLYRPERASDPLPTLIAWTPYGKHDPAPIAVIYPASGAKAEWMSDHTIFEAPDPAYWCAHGYAVLTIDIPGLWHAQSPAHFIAPEEAEACADAIQWAGTRAWSNGKVGLSGVSYLTVSQWRVAELNPPHLAAICPWEGWTDTYREVVYHGGIPETFFWPYIQTRWGASDHMIEDLWAETAEHPFYDEFWETKSARLERIEVRPGLRRRELERSQPAQPRHAGRFPPDLIAEEVAPGSRPQEMGPLLRSRECRAAARLLRPFPERNRARAGLARRPLRIARSGRIADAAQFGRMAAARGRVSAFPSRSRRFGAGRNSLPGLLAHKL